jgi:hypothetical protein
MTAPEQPTPEARLWLWRNGDHYLAYEHEYPCYSDGGDPLTLGEPVGYAIFKPSAPPFGSPEWVAAQRAAEAVARERDIRLTAEFVDEAEEALSSATPPPGGAGERARDFSAAVDCAHTQYENYVRQGQLNTEDERRAALRDALSHAVGILKLRSYAALQSYGTTTASQAQRGTLEECARWHEAQRPQLSGSEYALASESKRKKMRDDARFHAACAKHFHALVTQESDDA